MNEAEIQAAVEQARANIANQPKYKTIVKVKPSHVTADGKIVDGWTEDRSHSVRLYVEDGSAPVPVESMGTFDIKARSFRFYDGFKGSICITPTRSPIPVLEDQVDP
jgi:hypothetical protein